MLVIFEGLDCAGKSTQAKKLCQYLKDMGKDAVVLRQPGSTPLGDHLRSLIKNPPKGIDISNMAERLLFAADNAQFIDTHLRNIPEGRVIIMDRCTFISDLPYGLSCGVLEETINNIEAVIPDPPKADVMFLMLSEDVMVDRMAARSQTEGIECRIEARGIEYLSKVNEVYHRLCDDFIEKLHRHAKKIEVIDSVPSVEEVWEDIKGRVNNLI